MNQNIKHFIDPNINNQGTYLVINKQQAFLVDAGGAINQAVQHAKTNNIMIESLIITHGHLDHIMGIDYLVISFPHVKIYINQWDEDCLFSAKHNLSIRYENPVVVNTPIMNNLMVLLGDASLDLAGLKVDVVHIPGHTPGTQYVLVKQYNALFVGDTIFQDKIGFHSIPYCDDKYFKRSLAELIKLDANLDVYPGHHNPFVLQEAIKNNQPLIEFLKK